MWRHHKSPNRDPKTLSDFSCPIMEVQEGFDPTKPRIVFAHPLSLNDNGWSEQLVKNATQGWRLLFQVAGNHLEEGANMLKSLKSPSEIIVFSDKVF
jgi:hypothetical protein